MEIAVSMRASALTVSPSSSAGAAGNFLIMLLRGRVRYDEHGRGRRRWPVPLVTNSSEIVREDDGTRI